MKRITICKAVAAGLLALAVSQGSMAQDFSSVEIKTTKVADGVYALQGAGGNLGLVVGEDGAFLIDDQYAPLTEQILAAIAEVTTQAVDFVFNTHWHGDHTGGNENMHAANAVIVAHNNVRKRLSAGQLMEFFDNQVPPAANAALPVVTFNDEVSFHMGGQTINAIHVPHAHTDGDSILHLVEANAIHAGDIVFYGLYPFIDYGSGGSLAGMIEATDTILALADDQTAIITGHGGPVINQAQLHDYRHLLATVHARLASLIDEGKTLEQVQEAGVTAEFDDQWGDGFIGPERWVELNYKGMTAKSN
ncbi:MAG: MBL fold metallo-hydrolase [Wenzhouxiangellaceae bacterium]|nr:MBL fold metallo-hydrolase [Wenzhouxiangellaceae bacterium]